MIDRWQRRSGRVWLFTAVWLTYLTYPLISAWRQSDPTLRATGVAALLMFAAAFSSTFWLYQRRLRDGKVIPSPVRWLVIAAMAALLAIAAPAAGQAVLAGTAYLAVMAVLTLPAAQAWSVVAALVVGAELVPRFVAGWSVDTVLTVQLLVSAVAAWGVAQAIERGGDLARAREQLAELAVGAERDRVARDIHDILGHSLTVIAVKAELAGALMSLDPARAGHEVADVERLARASLADIRATVGGLRQVTLAGELAGARTAFAAAGIDAVLPVTIDDVPSERDELFGWVVREGTTNIIRHSGATRCEIRLCASGVEVLDDGRCLDAHLLTAAGHGLRGLGERVEAAGGALSAAPQAGGGFRLCISTPDAPR